MSALRHPQPDHHVGQGADPVGAERVRETLELAKRFVDAVFDDPALAEEIPDGATLVMFDRHHPSPDRSKAEAADKMERAGQVVHRMTL